MKTHKLARITASVEDLLFAIDDEHNAKALRGKVVIVKNIEDENFFLYRIQIGFHIPYYLPRKYFVEL